MTSPFVAAPRAAIADLARSQIREVANAGMGRDGILAFWFGESDRATPDFIREAAMQSLKDEETFYTQNLGRPALRQAIAEYETRLHGKTVAAERVARVQFAPRAAMRLAVTVSTVV